MEPVLGMICIFGFNFAPRGWAFCQGQIMSIAQNTALFSLLGTTYGGDGKTTFALPNLSGRTAIGQGQGAGLSPRTLGEIAGTETVTLITNQIPAHNHQMMCSTDGATANAPQGNSLGAGARGAAAVYAPGASNQVPMASATSVAGGNQSHNNMQPYLAMNYCIALEGIFPSRN